MTHGPCVEDWRVRTLATPANAHDAMPNPFDRVVDVQNWENARHLRTMCVLSANAFAVVIAACLMALQRVSADRLIELTTLGFLVAVAAVQLLISLALKRELDDCMACIEGQLAGTRWRDLVGLLPQREPGPGGCTCAGSTPGSMRPPCWHS